MEKDFYTVEDIAQKKGWSVNDVLYKISSGELIAVFRFDKVKCRRLIPNGKGWMGDPDKLADFSYNGFFQPTKNFWLAHHPIKSGWSTDITGAGFLCEGAQFIPMESTTVTIDDLWMLAKDIRAYESAQKVTRTDAMRSEIRDIIDSGIEPIFVNVWRELERRCGQAGSPCLRKEETDKGPVIVWNGAKGKVNRLTENSLKERLRGEKTG